MNLSKTISSCDDDNDGEGGDDGGGGDCDDRISYDRKV
jgi:hypothetical protein